MPVAESNHTPREFAYDVAISWLRAAYAEITDDVEHDHPPMRIVKARKKQIAKLHNRLLRQSGMDGLEIEHE